MEQANDWRQMRVTVEGAGVDGAMVETWLTTTDG